MNEVSFSIRAEPNTSPLPNTTPTMAAFTDVGAPFAGEDSHAEIFSQVYGGTFAADGNGFSNGSITGRATTTVLTPGSISDMPKA